MRPGEAIGRSRPKRGPKPMHAIVLGLLQGPTELLPVSSSAHIALIPRLAGWSYYDTELTPAQRKSFEVALHLGAGAALALDMRDELGEAVHGLNVRRVATIGLSLAPAVLAGYVLEGPIERRLGGPRSTAAGLIAGAIAMAIADAYPARRRLDETDGRLGRDGRREQDAGPLDGLALGMAQATALMPGISRSGATLTAARARGFAREDAHALSWHAALPVILGAGALKGWRRLRCRQDGGCNERGELDSEDIRAGDDAGNGGSNDAGGGGSTHASSTLAIGAASAFASTWASARVLRRPRVSRRSLLPWAAYRCALAAVTLHQAGRDAGGAQNMKR